MWPQPGAPGRVDPDHGGAASPGLAARVNRDLLEQALRNLGENAAKHTAAGRVVTCNEHDNPDLFWASRGGGGGNFGVATAFTFRVFPVDQVSTFMLEWPWEHAQTLAEIWQQTAPHAPDESISEELFVRMTEFVARLVGTVGTS